MQPAGSTQGCDDDAGGEAVAGRGSQSAAVDSRGAAPASVSVGSPGSSTGHAEERSSADAWGAADEEEPCVGRAGGGDGPEEEEVAAEHASERQRRSGALGRAAEQLFPGGRDEGMVGALVAAAYPDRVAQRRARGNRRAACRMCVSTPLHQLSCESNRALVAAAYPDRVAQRRERGNRRAACWTCMSTPLHSCLVRATGR